MPPKKRKWSLRSELKTRIKKPMKMDLELAAQIEVDSNEFIDVDGNLLALLVNYPGVRLKTYQSMKSRRKRIAILLRKKARIFTNTRLSSSN